MLKLLMLTLVWGTVYTQTYIDVVVPISGKVSFTSPGFPKPYDSNSVVFYRFIGPSGRAIQFDSETFSLEFGSAGPAKDSLVFSEALPGRGEVVFGTFYRVKGPRKLRSNTNQVIAAFTTDHVFDDIGFSITAASTAPYPAVDVSVSAIGKAVFTSPGFPALYGNQLNVVYKITGPVGYGIQFDAEAFALENDGADSLELSEFISGVGEVTLQSFYGSIGPNRIRSTTNVVTATFKTDRSVADTGFQIAAQSLKPQPIGGPVSDVCLSIGLTVNCVKGAVLFSDPDWRNTEAVSMVLAIDRTLACRSVIYEAHTWILSQQQKTRQFSEGVPLTVSCSRDGIVVSESEPDDSEADRLIFTTTANQRCHNIFVNFLNYLSSL